jgi:hypothetical protein
MSQIFILQNQNKHFFGKNKEWVDGFDPNVLFKTPHKDEAINQMVEISSKDYLQRVKILSCEIDEKGLPTIDIDLMPAPLPKVAKPARSANSPSTSDDQPSLEAANLEAKSIEPKDLEIENLCLEEDHHTVDAIFESNEVPEMTSETLT